MKNEAEHRIRYYIFISEPVFCETPNKTTIFVVEFREENGVPRSAESFS